MNNYCQKHPDEKLTLFCDHCECLACRDCAIATHRGHSCNFITDVEAEFREEFADKIDRSEEKLMNLTGKFYRTVRYQAYTKNNRVGSLVGKSRAEFDEKACRERYRRSLS